MLEVRQDHRCCDRLAATKTAVRTSRRRLLKDAVFRAQDAASFRELSRVRSATSARTCS